MSYIPSNSDFSALRRNLLLNADSYKASHFLQYPPNTTQAFSYIESRGGEFNYTVFFGLQIFLKEYLSRPITQTDIEIAEKIWLAHGEPFNRAGWEYILQQHGGKLPVRIKALAEGSIVPTSQVLMTIENTDEACFWLPSFLETSLLSAVWYGTTVATLSRHVKEIIHAALEKTGDTAGLPFKLHDFGQRGVSSFESAGIGGAAHLINFMGSDTMNGILTIMHYYDSVTEMPAFSIPAAEHSTITSYGRDKEVDAYRMMLRQFAKPNSLVAIVSDSYDIFNAVSEIFGKTLRQEIIDSGATVIIRPDSGVPDEIVLETLIRLDAAFGSKMNAKGYKVINHVRIIQGDGINIDSIEKIINTFVAAGYSADNVAFGMGGGLLQQLNRDTLRFAMKCSAVLVDGVWRDVYKDPITDQGKRSKKGRLSLVKTATGTIQSKRIEEIQANDTELLHTVFENGELYHTQSFAQVRAQAAL